MTAHAVIYTAPKGTTAGTLPAQNDDDTICSVLSPVFDFDLEQALSEIQAILDDDVEHDILSDAMHVNDILEQVTRADAPHDIMCANVKHHANITRHEACMQIISEAPKAIGATRKRGPGTPCTNRAKRTKKPTKPIELISDVRVTAANIRADPNYITDREAIFNTARADCVPNSARKTRLVRWQKIRQTRISVRHCRATVCEAKKQAAKLKARAWKGRFSRLKAKHDSDFPLV